MLYREYTWNVLEKEQGNSYYHVCVFDSACIYVRLTHLLFLRLYTCMLTLQLSKQLDVCTVSTAIAVLMKDSTNIRVDGPLSRIGEC